jgi:Tetratricopeptide repeat
VRTNCLLLAAAALGACAIDKPDVRADAQPPEEPYSHVYWPLAVRPIPFPIVERDGSGRVTIKERPIPQEARDFYLHAERAFFIGNCSEAEQLYNRALAIAPAYEQALIGLGDCAFRRSQFSEAAQLFERAIAVAPDDYQPRMFRADALARDGKPNEALEALSDALSLRPRYGPLLLLAHKLAAQLDIEVHDEPLEPKALLTGGKMYVVKDSGSFGELWTVYAKCNPLPVTKPGEERRWNARSEAGCLLVLAQAYTKGRLDEAVPRDAALDRLAAAFAAGDEAAFVVYEIASVLDPQFVLRHEAAQREIVREYVKKYVLVPRTAPPAPDRKSWVPPSGAHLQEADLHRALRRDTLAFQCPSWSSRY